MWMSVGRTRSRKKVFAATRSESISELFDGPHSQFTQNDYFDSYAIFQFLIMRARARGTSIELADEHCHEITQTIGLKRLWEIAGELKLHTVVDICNFGRKLVNVEFTDMV